MRGREEALRRREDAMRGKEEAMRRREDVMRGREDAMRGMGERRLSKDGHMVFIYWKGGNPIILLYKVYTY